MVSGGSPAMFVSIGEFSQMTRLSTKALRLYDEKGLLKPAHVDSATGYRYYELGQANRAEAVRILRSVDMPLDEIKSVLEADDAELAHKQLETHRMRLADRLAADERMLAYLESLMNRKQGIMPYTVQLEEVAPQLVAATRVRTSLSKIGDDIAMAFGTLVPALGAAGLDATGAPLIVYHEIIDDETDGDIEVCIPVGAEMVEAGAVYTRVLEGGPVAATVHQGRYEEIAPAYHTLAGWISEHGRATAGPPREIYLNDPQMVQPDELLTRVEFPVREESGTG